MSDYYIRIKLSNFLKMLPVGFFPKLWERKIVDEITTRNKYCIRICFQILSCSSPNITCHDHGLYCIIFSQTISYRLSNFFQSSSMDMIAIREIMNYFHLKFGNIKLFFCSQIARFANSLLRLHKKSECIFTIAFCRTKSKEIFLYFHPGVIRKTSFTPPSWGGLIESIYYKFASIDSKNS